MKPKPDQDILKHFREEAAAYDKWANFYNSDFGKYFIKFLDEAMEETVLEEDKFNVYEKTEHHILYHLAAVRSKRQTLRAIKTRAMEAEKKRNELLEELSKYKE
jgi:hypothetical protein